MKSFSISNIKAFKEEADIEIKPITILVGRNSCGKSSLIRFPAVISQSLLSDADASIMFFGKNIDYGNYEDVVFGHDIKKKVSFSLTYDCVPDYFGSSMLNNNYLKKVLTGKNEIALCVTLRRYSKRLIVDAFEMKVNGVTVLYLNRSVREIYNMTLFDYSSKSKITTFTAKHVRFFKFIPYISVVDLFDDMLEAFCDANKLDLQDRAKLKKMKKNVIGSYLIPDEKKEYGDNTEIVEKLVEWCEIVDFCSVLSFNVRIQALNEAGLTYYVGPFRESPNRVYRDVEHRVDTVGAKGEDTSAMLKNDYMHGKKIINDTSEWFEKSMNYGVNVKEIGSGLYKILVKKDDGTQDNLIDVGYGISQVLPIVAQVMKIKAGDTKAGFYISSAQKTSSTFIVEQPELHLHPDAQAELASLFVDAVTSKNKELNVIIETHSEHMIRKLQTLVADNNVKISNDDVKIYYIDKNENNEAYVTEMKMLPNGKFESEWPTGFFDKSYTLALELIKNNAYQEV